MLFRNSSIYIIAKLIPGVMAFSALAVYTHLLTPEEYGVYTLIFTATIFTFATVFNWLPVGMVRFWPSGKYDEGTFISTMGILYRCLSLPIIIIAAIIAVFVNSDALTYLVAALFLLFSHACLKHGQMQMTSQIRPKSYAIMTISYSVLALLLGAMMAYLGFGPVGLLLGIGAGMLIPSLIQSYSVWTKYDKDKFSPELTQKLAIYGMPLAASFFLEQIANVSDRYMLAWFVNEAEAGKYAVGYDLAGNSIIMIMSAINLAAYPMIVKLLENEGKEAALEYFKTYSVLLLGVSIPAVVGLSLVGPNIVNLLIGAEYRDSVTLILPWVACGIFFMGAGAFYVHLPFQLSNNNMGIFKIAGFVATLNLVLNYFLIPLWGMEGAAIATLLSFMASVTLGYIFGQRVFPIPFPAKDVLKILSAALLMGICLYLLKDLRGWLPLLFQISSGLGIFVISAYLLDIGGIKATIAQYLKMRQAEP